MTAVARGCLLDETDFHGPVVGVVVGGLAARLPCPQVDRVPIASTLQGVCRADFQTSYLGMGGSSVPDTESDGCGKGSKEKCN